MSRPVADRAQARAGAGAALMAALAVLVGIVTGGCGVPAETEARVLPPEDLPFGLAGDDPTAGPNEAAALEFLNELEVVSLYFPAGNGLAVVPRQLTAPVALDAVVDALADGTGPTGTATYRSAIGRGDVEAVRVRAGVATVELDNRFLDLPNSEQRVAVAQLVLTLTSRPGVGQIVFEIGGAPVQVPRADGTLAKGAVSRDDFVKLLAG